MVEPSALTRGTFEVAVCDEDDNPVRVIGSAPGVFISKGEPNPSRVFRLKASIDFVSQLLPRELLAEAPELRLQITGPDLRYRWKGSFLVEVEGDELVLRSQGQVISELYSD